MKSSILRIAHVAPGLDMGGLEKVLVELARHTDRSRFDLTFVSLDGRGILADEIEGVLVVLCGTARAVDARKRLSLWARRQRGAVHRGVLSRLVSGPAEVPAADA